MGGLFPPDSSTPFSTVRRVMHRRHLWFEFMSFFWFICFSCLLTEKGHIDGVVRLTCPSLQTSRRNRCIRRKQRHTLIPLFFFFFSQAMKLLTLTDTVITISFWAFFSVNPKHKNTLQYLPFIPYIPVWSFECHHETESSYLAYRAELHVG